MCVVLFKLSNEEYVVETGNRIAQLIIERCFTPNIIEVSEFTEDKTKEDRKGLGLFVNSLFYKWFVFWSFHLAFELSKKKFKRN